MTNKFMIKYFRTSKRAQRTNLKQNSKKKTTSENELNINYYSYLRKKKNGRNFYSPIRKPLR